jgi:hypoxanthine-guanine phosphoribosyltransferase
LQGAIFEPNEQRLSLAQLQISDEFHVINFGTNSNLNLPCILKGFKPFGTNLVNSLKIYLEVIFLNMNLVGHTCMQENEVSTQVSLCLVLKIKEKSLNLKFKQTQLIFHLNFTIIWRGTVQALYLLR